MFHLKVLIEVILVLAVLIVFHEYGHFLAARLFGVRVLRFSVGFGPKIIGRQIGETEYTICAVPLGGYVNLLGENPDETLSEADRARAFSTQSVWRRTLIVAAGPVFNLLLALLLFIAVAAIGLPALIPQVGNIQHGMPAEQAGLLPGDTIRSIDGQEITHWEEIQAEIQRHGGKTLTMVVEREGQRLSLQITPVRRERPNIFGEMKPGWLIGIQPKGTVFIRRFNPAEAVTFGVRRTVEITVLTVVGLVKIVEQKLPANTIGGPILIAQMVGQQASEGLLPFLLFIAVLSVNLGVLNLLPIPVLDGGHLLFFAIEAVIGRPVSIRKREVAQQVGFALLISLMLFAVYNDIMRFFVAPGSQ